MAERTNAEWREALATQDADAWRELSNHLYEWSYNLLAKILDRLSPGVWKELAIECVQDAGIRILNRLDQYQGSGSFLGWCRVIVVNVTRDRIRIERRRLRVELQDLPESGQVAVEDFAPGVAEQAFIDELVGRIYAFVESQLTDREQRVFLALAEGESTPKELALELNTTRNNIDQTWFRARKKAREHLEKSGYTVEMLQRYHIL